MNKKKILIFISLIVIAYLVYVGYSFLACHTANNICSYAA